MAFIPKTNVVNGNTIQASDITNIIDSLNGTGLYDISATGSLLGTASFATTASYVLNVPPPSGPDAAVQFKSGSVFSGSANFKFDYTLNSLAQGSGNTVIGSNSHAEGSNTKTGTQNAYYADSVSSGVITLSASYSDVSAEFVADNLLYLYDTPFDGIYLRAYFPISQSYYAAPNTIVELYDTSVTTTTAYVGDINYGLSNWTGDQTIPGDYSHAEGESTFAINSYAHAEGSATSAVGTHTHAEGTSTQALGNYSHAEGELTQAIGNYAHTEGGSTKAIGDFSHAEGDTTIAIGYASHTAGRSTIASGSYQFVVGQQNEHGDTTSLFIVGGGLEEIRKDAFKVTHSSSIAIPQTQSDVPTWTGRDGEIVPVTTPGITGGHYLYMWMNGAWRSSSFA